MRKRMGNSLQKKIIRAFIFTSIVPLIFVMVFSYMNSSQIVRENSENMNHQFVKQMNSSLDVWIEAYEDILFQIYMNDDIIHLVEQLNEGNDNTLVRGQLRRTLRGMFYTKEYIKSISIITPEGESVFYDLLTGSTTKNSWSDSIGSDYEDLYHDISENNKTHFIPTHAVGKYASKEYYLFHIAHRLIDYRNISKQIGIVIVSIDEDIFQNIYNNNSDEGFYFIVNNCGQIISYDNKEYIGKTVVEWCDEIESRKKQYLGFMNELSLNTQYISLDISYSEKLNWDIVTVSNRDIYIKKLQRQRKMIIVMLCASFLAIMFLIYGLTKNLMKSVHDLTSTMKTVGNGCLAQRAREGDDVPAELNEIACHFNAMIDKLQESIESEKTAHIRQMKAEIMALETQLNPHFLYNTLDTINWVAIGKKDYEVSNSITCLANILRYGINQSNSEVELHEEIEWLKQYLYLQQMRLKSGFDCEIDVDDNANYVKIHKLLFQPFIENSIVHGLNKKDGINRLKIRIHLLREVLHIIIWDNGVGLSEDTLDRIKTKQDPLYPDTDWIGVNNAISRIRMYYGERTSVEYESVLGEYTQVTIRIPIERGESD